MCLLICVICFSSSIAALAATHYLLTGKGYTGRVRQFDRTINLATCTSKEMQPTMVHELGHALNLDDNPCNTTSDKGKSVMNYGRDRTVTKKPTSWDIEGVKASY